MKIRFLKNCEAPQVYEKTFCSCCGPERQLAEKTFFYAGQEEDPTKYNAEIDLSGLTYREDYDIIEYP